jgi:hypothetical protein
MSKSRIGPDGPVTIKHIREQSRVVTDLVAAAVEVVKNGLVVVEQLKAPDPFSDLSVYGAAGRSVVLLDECGLVIPVWRFEAAAQGVVTPVRSFRLWATGPNAYDPDRDFRKTPVAGVNRRRWGRFYRRVRTQGERRDLIGLTSDLQDEESFPLRVKIRKRREALPTAWDDLVVSGKGRGWKHHRRTRWKNRQG